LNICLVIGRIQSDGLSSSHNSHPETQDTLFVQRRYSAATALEAPKYEGDGNYYYSRRVGIIILWTVMCNSTGRRTSVIVYDITATDEASTRVSSEIPSLPPPTTHHPEDIMLPCQSYNYFHHTHGMALKTSGVRRLYYTYTAGGRPTEYCIRFVPVDTPARRRAGVCIWRRTSSDNDMDLEHGSRGARRLFVFPIAHVRGYVAGGKRR